MKQLIQIEPLRRMTRSLMRELIPHSGALIRSEVALPVPDGFKYVEIEEKPSPDPETQKLERDFTTEKDGWKITALSSEEITERQQSLPGVTQIELLSRLGSTKFATLLGLLDQLPQEAKWSWEYSPTIRLYHPLIIATRETLKSALELTEEEFVTLLTPNTEL